MQRLLSSHVPPTFIVTDDIEQIQIFASTFDLQSFYENNARSNAIYTKTINAFDILFTNPLWQPTDFIGFKFINWKPSNHIYSENAFNEPHKTPVNPFGKYLIRVFHSNYWRAITVDDQIPIDFDKRILLPFYYDDVGNKLQLWPILLTKAFLKLNQSKQDYSLVVEENVSHLSEEQLCECKSDRKFVDTNICQKNYFADLDPITMLTGWYGTEYKLNGLSQSGKWETILGICEQMKNNELVVLGIGKKNQQALFVQMLDIRYYPLVEPERE